MTKDKFFFIIVHIKLENNIYNVLNFDYIYIYRNLYQNTIFN